MRITNTIGWRKPWLKKVIRFCCQQLDYPIDSIQEATFRLTYRAKYRGLALFNSHSIRVVINPLNTYPLQAKRHCGLPELVQADAMEILVRVTAHEVAHLARWDRFARDWKWSGKRDIAKERETEHLARMVLAVFRYDRDRLLAAWGESGRGPVHPGEIYRHSCRRCGLVWNSAVFPFQAHSMSCGKCFPNWEAACEAGEFLAFEMIPAPRRGGRRFL